MVIFNVNIHSSANNIGYNIVHLIGSIIMTVASQMVIVTLTESFLYLPWKNNHLIHSF